MLANSELSRFWCLRTFRSLDQCADPVYRFPDPTFNLSLLGKLKMALPRRATLQEVQNVIDVLRRDHPEMLKAMYESFERADRDRDVVDYAGVDFPLLFRVIDSLIANVEEHDTSGRNAIFNQTIMDLKFEYLREKKGYR